MRDATTTIDSRGAAAARVSRQQQTSSDVLYSFLEAAVTDAFRLPAHDAADRDGFEKMPRSILRQGVSLSESIAEVRKEQLRRLGDYNAMIDIARQRADDNGDVAAGNALGVSRESREECEKHGRVESESEPKRTRSANPCPKSDTIPRDRLLMILREASSDNFRLPKDEHSPQSEERNALLDPRDPAASHDLGKAVSAVHSELAARRDEYQRMCDIAMSRSEDDVGVSDNSSKEIVDSKVVASLRTKDTIPHDRLLMILLEASSDNFRLPNDEDSAQSKEMRASHDLKKAISAVHCELAARRDEYQRMCDVAMSRSEDDIVSKEGDSKEGDSEVFASEHKSLYREGQGLRTEVAAVRQEIVGRLDEHKRMCAIAKSTPADGPADSKNELILSSARSAVSQAFAVPRPCNPAAGQNSLFRTSAKEELRQELEARLKEHQSMSRVAMSRSEDLSAISDKQEKSVEEESTSSETKTIHPSTNITAHSKLATPKTPDQPMPFTLKPSQTPHTGTHFGMTAPRFTEEEEAKEKAALTAEEKAEAQASIEGRKLPPTPPVSEHDSLDELELELQKIPDEDKAEYVEATAKCPGIAKDEALLLQFLRCVSVNFDAKAAARRVVAYWKRRVELFGVDKAFLPLSIATSLSDDGEALATGSYRILPDADDSGRLVIVYSVRHQMPDRYPRESMLRVFWYMVHATLENRSPNANGYVVLLNPVGPNEVFDRKLCKFMIDLDRECLPNQITAWHHLLSTPMLPIYAPFWKHQLGPRIRRVLTVHGSEIEENIQLLAGCGLSPDRLMTDLGGEVEMDYEKWVKDRRNRGI